MICPACQDDNHSACDSLACDCTTCNYGVPVPKPKTACQQCDGNGVVIDPPNPALGLLACCVICPRCQGSGRELADLAGIDRINGRHFMEG